MQEVHYGVWTEKEIVDIDWEARLKERGERESKEQMKRKERLEMADKMEKSWELARWLKTFINDNTNTWETESETRKKEEKKAEERQARKALASSKKTEFEERLIQKKIWESIKILPREKRNEIEEAEGKEKKKRSARNEN